MLKRNTKKRKEYKKEKKGASSVAIAPIFLFAYHSFSIHVFDAIPYYFGINSIFLSLIHEN